MVENNHFIILTDTTGQEFRQSTVEVACLCSKISADSFVPWLRLEGEELESFRGPMSHTSALGDGYQLGFSCAVGYHDHKWPVCGLLWISL